MRHLVGPMLLAVMAVSPAMANEDDIPLSRTPSEMSGAEIDAYNEGRTATDPDYIRCRRLEVPGSLVKKLRVCNTNTGWRQYADKGNQDARDSMQWIERGYSNSSEPKDDMLKGGFNPPK